MCGVKKLIRFKHAITFTTSLQIFLFVNFMMINLSNQLVVGYRVWSSRTNVMVSRMTSFSSDTCCMYK